MKLKKTVLLPVLAMSLSACGGGDEDGGSSFVAARLDEASAIAITGGSRLDLRPEEVKSEHQAIVNRSDKGHASAVISVDWDDNVTRDFSYCFGDRCAENSGIRDLFIFDFSDVDFNSVMTKNGIRLSRSSEREEGPGGGVNTRLRYGGWMEDSLFGVYVSLETYDGGTFLNSADGYSAAAGDSTGTNPSVGPYVWNGVMVGRDSDLESAFVSHVVQGDATISMTPSSVDDPSVDISFSNIKDLNNGQSRGDIFWTDLSVSEGAFGSNTIEGTFYGPGHGEVAGIFERNYILGAFGARR